MDTLVIGFSGALGALARYILSQWAKDWNHTPYPLGTFMINITGSFFIGLIMTLAIEKFVISPKWRLAITSGFLGGFTTFSTFAYETIQLINNGRFGLAMLYAIASIAFGLIGAWVGISLARLVEKRED